MRTRTRAGRLHAAPKTMLTGMALAAVLVLVTACGSSSSGSKAPATSSSGTPVSGDPIVIGAICSCSGLAAVNIGNGKDIIDAWQSWVNDHGGLNGHPVKVIFKDDGGTAATSTQMVKELVEQDHVVAIVDALSSDDISWAKYVADSGVPLLGSSLVEALDPDFFPSGDVQAGVFAAVDLINSKGYKKVGLVYCAETEGCASEIPLYKEVIPATSGGTASLVYTASVSATAPNYTAQCLAAKEKGVDMLILGSFGAVNKRVFENCQQQGYTPAISGPDSGIVPKNTDPDGMYWFTTNIAVNNTSTPGGKRFQEILDTYAPSVKTKGPLNYSSMMIYSGFALFEAAANSGKLTPTSTAADVKTALYGLPPGTTLDGIAPPLTFTAGKATHVPCWFTEQINNGTITSPLGDKPKCVPADQMQYLEPLYGVFAKAAGLA